MAVNYGSLPFLEALAFFRAKLNLPTQRWDDLLGAAHDRAFVVAGAMQADLLEDLRNAVDKAMEQGTTYETFKKDFKKIVAERGWTGWTGEGTQAGEAWRARVIYDTNLFSSYSAGRLKQMKAVAETRPWWRYRHSPASLVPRKEHLAWDGVILRHDDPFWASHTPPNGFNCFLAGTEVATPTGWQPIETLRRGDQVIGGSGNIQTVETPQIRPFEGDIVWITTKQGEVAATPNHRFLTLRGWIRAENLEGGEMLVQIPQVTRINHSIGDIQHPNAASAQFSVARPFHVLQTLRSEAFNPHIERGQKNIHPIGEKAAVMNRIKSPVCQLLQKQSLNSRGRSASVNVGRRVLLMKLPLGIAHLGPYFRAKRGRTAFQLFRAASHTLIGFFGFPQAIMKAVSRLLQCGLPQNLSGLFSASVVFDPLDQNSLAIVSGFHTKPSHQPHNRAVVAAPTLAKTGNRPSLLSVQDPEGFVSGAPLDRFNSLEDFRRWARAHGVISNVVAIRRQSYTGSVYNLSITEDASYCLRLGVVHNCKCYVETLADRDLQKQGLTVTDREKIQYNGKDPDTGLPLGVDKGWDYQPGANRTTPLYDLIARKLPKMDAALGAAMWAALKDALAMEQQLAWWNTLDEWLESGKQANRLAVIGAIDPLTLAWLGSEKNIQPLTAEIAVLDSLILGPKQRRHADAGNALTQAEWRKLPEMLIHPERILFDTRSGKLLYVYPSGGTDKAKIAVEFDYQRSRKQQITNAVVSAFRTQQTDIDGMIKGGIWEVAQ